MADDTYVIDEIATGTATETLSDDGTGNDWLKINGTYPLISDIRLSWSSNAGISTAASGLYWSKPGTSHRLVVNGLIENVRGGNGEDFIQGNELGNRLIGDKTDAGSDDVIWGLGGNDVIFGGAGNDELSGDDGNDRIFGGVGADAISGNSGRDYIEGGAGADSMTGGGDGKDTVSFRSSAEGVKVFITFGAATTNNSGGDAEGDSISGFNNVDGSDFSDTLTDTVDGTVAFGGNDNMFRGLGGNDKLLLGGGDDRAYGGDGNDLIQGGLGNDKAFGGSGNDTLNMDEGNDIAYGGGGRDLMRGGDGDDVLVGGAGNDIIFTNAGDDIARGGLGNDQILTTEAGHNSCYGGDGADALIAAGGVNEFWGGTGVDSFEFRVQAANLAGGDFTTIHDFQRGQGEHIDLRVFKPMDFVGTAEIGRAHV